MLYGLNNGDWVEVIAMSARTFQIFNKTFGQFMRNMMHCKLLQET